VAVIFVYRTSAHTLHSTLQTTSTWEEQQKMDALRKVYHRAVQIPLDNVERLWSELETFETNLNKITVHAVIFQFHCCL
jgi:hypothetical protein